MTKCIFCYHKVGTTLFSSILKNFSDEFGWDFEIKMGSQPSIPDDVDYVLFAHSQINLDTICKPYLGVHVIRDPRDIIVSGYLYHMRTSEAWCTRKDFDITAPIGFPNVPYSQLHRSEEWKTGYIASLEGISYRENLELRSVEDGLIFEMEHYGAWTIARMLDWNYENENILEMKFESIMNDYNNAFKTIFEFMKLDGAVLDKALYLAGQHNIKNMPDSKLAMIDQISSKETSKWQHYFTPRLKNYFNNKFGDCLIALGYEESSQW